MNGTLTLTERRARIGDWIESTGPQRFIIALIVINAITLGLETSVTVQHYAGGLLVSLEQMIVTLFALEIALKIIGRGLNFFRSGWNWFDFIIVVIALMPATGAFSVLRALRILRVLRLITTIPRLRGIIESLLHAIPSIGWVALLLALVFYIFAVLGTNLFGQSFPDWFGTLGGSLYTLFQIMTLESWSMGIARPVIEAYPYAWLYFVPFILVSTFTMLNLFIAIIVSTMQSLHMEEEEAKRAGAEAIAHDERVQILHELKALNEKLDRMGRRG
ncbi:ion transporter [Ectothiorhodospiraceae bacterium 2226]|nr:ion transporter [Ectothiorhodospiraceae bacterium 2226]